MKGVNVSDLDGIIIVPKLFYSSQWESSSSYPELYKTAIDWTVTNKYVSIQKTSIF